MNNNVFTSRMEGSFLQPDIDCFSIQPITQCNKVHKLFLEGLLCEWRASLAAWMNGCPCIYWCVYMCEWVSVYALWPSPSVESCVSACMCFWGFMSPGSLPLQRPQEPPRSEREKEGERVFTFPYTGHLNKAWSNLSHTHTHTHLHSAVGESSSASLYLSTHGCISHYQRGQFFWNYVYTWNLSALRPLKRHTDTHSYPNQNWIGVHLLKPTTKKELTLFFSLFSRGRGRTTSWYSPY